MIRLLSRLFYKKRKASDLVREKLLSYGLTQEEIKELM